MSETWVVLHCPVDDSHVLVQDTVVIYDDELSVGDRVKFSFPGCKNLLTGDVMGVSGDYNVMLKLQNSLNSSTKPKRQSSFHAGERRKAAKKCRQGLLQGSSKQKTVGKILPSKSPVASTSSAAELPAASQLVVKPTQTASKSLAEKFIDDPALWDGDNTDNNDSASDDSLDEDEKQLKLLVEKLSAKKQRKYDLRLLKGLTSNNLKPPNAEEKLTSIMFQETIAPVNDADTAKMDSSQSGSQLVNEMHATSSDKPEVISCSQSKVQTEPKKGPSEERRSDNTLSSNGRETKRKSVLKTKSHTQFKRRLVQIKFEEESLKWKSTDDGVEKLWVDNEAYILEKDLKKAKNTCGNPSLLTRFLVKAIFTQEATENCSVSGKPPLVTHGQDFVEVRSKLNQEGVEAIVAYVDHRASKKNWKVPPASTIKQYMANVLCEQRAEARIRKEAAKEENVQNGEGKSDD